MPQNFSFNVADYKNEFPATIVQSDILVNENAEPEKRNQYWSLSIVHIEKDDAGNWQNMPGTCVFELNGNARCPLREDAATDQYAQTFHNHWSVWSSTNPASQAFRLIVSFRDKGHYTVTMAKDVVGKRFVFTEEVEKGYNRKSDGKLITPHYFYVSGEIEAALVTPLTPPDELPWDAQAPAEMAAPAPVVQAPIVEPAVITTNGNAASTEVDVASLSEDDIDHWVVALINGKSEDDAKIAIRSEGVLYNNPKFRLRFIQNKFADSAIAKGYLTLANGAYKATDKAL